MEMNQRKMAQSSDIYTQIIGILEEYVIKLIELLNKQ